MYVCICKGVTDKQIQEFRQQGVNTYQQLRECTGVGTQCGKCSTEARSHLRQSSSVGDIALYAP